MLLRNIFLFFSTIVSIYLQLQESHYIFICEIWLFDLFFLSSGNLICRGTGISKYFRESLELRDESRLYFVRTPPSPLVLLRFQ